MDEAEPLTRECLKIMRKVYGNEHPVVAESLNNLAALLSDQVGLKVHMLFSQSFLNVATTGQIGRGTRALL